MKNTNKKLVGFYHYGVILTYLSVVAAIVGICFSVRQQGARPDIGVIVCCSESRRFDTRAKTQKQDERG
ncbi:MAG: hypothetical protein ACLRSW_15570 [Christensenellaceae bacterium]